MGTESTDSELQELLWLADLPLYIDSKRIEQFYDALVMPLLSADSAEELESEALVNRKIPVKSKMRVRNETYEKIQGSFGAKAGFSTGELLQRLIGLPKAEVGLSGDLAARRDETHEDEKTVEFEYATSPSRQLVQLALHYRYFPIDVSASRWIGESLQ